MDLLSSSSLGLGRVSVFCSQKSSNGVTKQKGPCLVEKDLLEEGEVWAEVGDRIVKRKTLGQTRGSGRGGEAEEMGEWEKGHVKQAETFGLHA